MRANRLALGARQEVIAGVCYVQGIILDPHTHHLLVGARNVGPVAIHCDQNGRLSALVME